MENLEQKEKRFQKMYHILEIYLVIMIFSKLIILVIVMEFLKIKLIY